MTMMSSDSDAVDSTVYLMHEADMLARTYLRELGSFYEIPDWPQTLLPSSLSSLALQE